MKKSLLIIAVMAIFAACNNSKPIEPATSMQQFTPMPDTVGLAEFQHMKEQQQFVDMNGVQQAPQTDNATALRESAPAAAPVVYRTAPAKTTRTVRYTKPARSTQSAPVRTSSDRYGNEEAGSTSDIPDVATQPTIGTGTENGVGDGPVVATLPEETKKKGWSKAAKGTAIGAGSGAVLGAIIGKNKAKGAIIGGVVGAAGGYVLGRVMDKKDGRY